MSNFNLIGNPQAWHNLVNDYLTGHMAHAYIFAGIQGIGKALVAKEYIKYILNANEILSERIDNNNFLDFLYITKEEKQEISIDKIREALEFLMLTPMECDKKFIIIDSADDLNVNASNALLKILEEPTKNTYLFLVCHSPSKLLRTIKSRCRMIKFFPLSNKEISAISGNNVMEDFAAGSLKKSKQGDVIKLYENLLMLLKTNNIAEINKFSDKIAKRQDEWELVIDLLSYIINRCAKLNFIKLSELEKDFLPELAQRKTVEQWLNLYNELHENIRLLNIFNLDKKNTFLTIFQKIQR